MIVVSDTTPLIGLASIDRLSLLKELFEEVYIPQAVFDETVTFGREDSKAKQEVANAEWINIIDEMDLGEVETIILASEMNADWVLMDEKKGRRKLTQLNIQKIGTLGILLKAKELKLIKSLKIEIENLQKTGFSISQPIIEKMLELANE
jgi:uncharacterized protein